MATTLHPERFRQITGGYGRLSIALLGDLCLDRYLDIDPSLTETSLETFMPVHNVVNVRCYPGGTGTILNNLVSLGIERVFPIGLCGNDGEGFELMGCLRGIKGVCMDTFLQTPLRRTFTYCKPLIVERGKPPREMSRLDSKNWTLTPAPIEDFLIEALGRHGHEIDALLMLEQTDVPNTGALTTRVLEAVGQLAAARPELLVLADSRRGLRGYPSAHMKMNRKELGMLLDATPPETVPQAKAAAAELSRRHGRKVFVTLGPDGLLGADASGEVAYAEALPLRGPIDIVGAGDAVTASLAASLASGATLGEAVTMANAAASIAIHQLGTTGTASVEQIGELVLTK